MRCVGELHSGLPMHFTVFGGGTHEYNVIDETVRPRHVTLKSRPS